MNYHQNGDLLLFPIGYDNCIEPVAKSIPKGAKKIKGALLHLGATGHHHTIKGTGFAILEKDGKRFIRAAKAVHLHHEEHKPLKLPKGEYELRFVQEIDPFSGLKRAVVD